MKPFSLKSPGAKAFLTAALLTTASAAGALGLGKAPAALTLGSYLDVSIPLRLEAGEDVADGCVTADVYFGEDKLGVGTVRARVESVGAERVVRILSNARISEPVVSLYVAVGCTSRVSRKFVVFADPPAEVRVATVDTPVAAALAADAGAQPASAAAAATRSPLPASRPASRPVSQTAAAGSRADALASAGSTAMAELPSEPVARREPGPKRRPPASASAGTPGGAQLSRTRSTAPDADRVATPSARAPRKPATAATPVPAAPRLQLDPIEADTLLEPSLRLSLQLAGMPTAESLDAPAARARREAAAALWRALNATPEEMARDRQRLQELEARLARLQADTQTAQQTVVALQARVQKAESERVGRGVLYALVALCGALAAALGWLLWKRREERAQAAGWWTASSEPSQPELVADAPVSASPSRGEHTGYTDAPGQELAPATSVPPATTTAAPSPALPISASLSTPMPAAVGALAPAVPPQSRREVSVEELIDLEQQAEFFMVLGQDQSAIDLLESHIQTTSGSSPLPYLKLMELYRRRSDRMAYDVIRERFNDRFNAYAPSWEADQLQGHTLADYPGVVDRLQSLWAQPERAMEVLQASLLKRNPSDETFDLPAYRELLMLYSVARDLSERTGDTGTAHLASVPAMAQGPVASPEPVEPLMATRPVKTFVQAQRPIDVDLALPDLDDAPAAVVAPVPVDVMLDVPDPAPAPSAPQSLDFEPPDDAPGRDALRRGGSHPG